jgi:hypothetical protein
VMPSSRLSRLVNCASQTQTENALPMGHAIAPWPLHPAVAMRQKLRAW